MKYRHFPAAALAAGLIALEADGIKIDSLQYLAAIADESCCGIMYLETGNETHVLGSEIQNASSANTFHFLHNSATKPSRV